MPDGRADALSELAVQFGRRGRRAQVHENTLLVALGTRGERVIICAGRRFRWGGERGHVLGEVGAESAAAERALIVLKQLAR
ncbi:hypothetical protein [Actinomadura chibensis]|uniref:Uncharacterized protein n=1 Tax=Actinomadura chibensis TaxID=392828 RepID=A0A5D0NZS3_9ACTN|nr:hypothetical protein [Actinomadura chibensis]TYB49668.1 hypothetical protein FXF69_11540 [Actinomadura chibensis]